ncbi:hypothetical protein H2198_000220 [Neophaeococcomyces mojaviensis]|uniref:Uncharacterized protein n=1 Tax=Neophaeococcomyces mojaviensis TaxID=3383035 RepID=A0ACC3AL30_9EURO|nr:hypothetical protein H2198_000220 [Knufia sp. JES_112]
MSFKQPGYCRTGPSPGPGRSEKSASSMTPTPSSSAGYFESHNSGNIVESVNRVFSPISYGFAAERAIDELTQERGAFVYLSCSHDNKRCKYCGGHSYHADIIVIAADGVCPNNGKANNLVFSAAGVYVGHHNPLNGGYTLVDVGATNQKAELQAGIKGLETALNIEPKDLNGAPLSTLVIKTDSKYMYEGITDYISKWKMNGWKTAAKKSVANKSLWEKLEATIGKVEDILKIRVLFWWVPRKYNEEADYWANFGYTGVKESDYENYLNAACDGDVNMKYLTVQEMIKNHPDATPWLIYRQGRRFMCRDYDFNANGKGNEHAS